MSASKFKWSLRLLAESSKTFHLLIAMNENFPMVGDLDW